jgi:hypothetical protein
MDGISKVYRKHIDKYFNKISNNKLNWYEKYIR